MGHASRSGARAIAGQVLLHLYTTGLLPRCPLQRLPAILRQVIKTEGLEGLPLYAFGASSGGGIALRLAQAMPEVKVRLRCRVQQGRNARACLKKPPAKHRTALVGVLPSHPQATWLTA